MAMKQRYLTFIRFFQESEGYALSETALLLASHVLKGISSADKAAATVVQSHQLQLAAKVPHTANGRYGDSGILVNRYGIQNQKLLDEIEMCFVSIRAAELLKTENDWKFDFADFRAIHRQLFGDLFPFAGDIRYVTEVQRTVFCLPQYIPSMAEQLFSGLKEEHFLKGLNREEFAQSLAYYMAEVHALHPFMDGNTRTLRLFFDQLSLHAGWIIDLTLLDYTSLLQADIKAIEGNCQPLAHLLSQALKPKGITND